MDARRPHRVWFALITLGIAAAFLVVSSHNIDNFRPISDDDNIVNDDVRADVVRLRAEVQNEFWDYVRPSCRQVASWRDDTYQAIDVYDVIPR